MYDVMDVSRFIINYCNDKGYFINDNKLQKILYYVQAMFIIDENENEPCFEDDILAGETGPYIPEVYKHFNKFGILDHIPPITYYKGCFEKNLTPKDKDFYEVLEYKTKILHKHQIAIQRMVDSLAKYSWLSLSYASKKEQPYINAANSYSKIIYHKDIYDYFMSENQEETPSPSL